MSEIICVPSAIPAVERRQHFVLASELFCERALERRELPAGYALRFSHAHLQAITRFISNESLCCPFLKFEITVEPDGGPVWLQMTGPQGTRELLEAELGLAKAAQCGCSSVKHATHRVGKWTALAGLAGSLGVCAACCFLPFVLAGMGVTGAWIGGFEALAPYKWLFIAMTFALLGYGFHAAHRSQRTVRRWLWTATILAVIGIIFEQVEPLLR